MDVEALYNEIGVSLVRAGDRWKAPCPFHTEQEPSFTVYPDGSYYCFGCNAYGTAEDIQEKYDLDLWLVPSIDDMHNPLDSYLAKLYDMSDAQLGAMVLSCTQRQEFKAYDLFDTLFIDARAMLLNPETTNLDLAGFIRRGMGLVKKATSSPKLAHKQRN